jgi:maleamate amidohydrolase
MDELEIYKTQNLGNPVGMGQKPALLIIDFVYGFTDPGQFGGGNINAAIARTVGALAQARQMGLPVVHTRVVYADDGADVGAFSTKVPNLLSLTETAHSSQIVHELTPVEGELVIRKKQASAFFGTDLAAWLHWNGIDTLAVAGCTTSGCVRASVNDAVAHNFRTMVLTDCVGDRAIGPHDANLFDMGQKYADLMTATEFFAALATAVADPVKAAG